MKTVYDYFIDFTNSLLKENSNYNNQKLRNGIKEYLLELDICDNTENAEKIAERELIRFRDMTPQTFIAFFETFSVRTRIIQLAKECELLAVLRIQEDKKTSKEIYDEKLNTFYNLAAEIVGDRRYTSWLDDATECIISSLKFASGQTDEISEKIIIRYITGY